MDGIPGKPWPKNFPEVSTLADYKAMKENPFYVAAKTGNNEAAVNLIQSLISNENKIFLSIGEKYPDAVLLGIHAEEREGKNKIPQVLVEYMGKITGLEVDKEILQSNIVSHTGAGQNVRLFARPEFDGNVQSGRDYILVDDMITMGGTMGELRHYIESRGGNVVSMISLSTRHESNRTIAQRDETKLDLQKTFGVKSLGGEYDMTPLNDFLKESGLYGGNYEALTESEARALIHIKTLDEARNRRTSAGQARDVSLRQQEV